MVTAVPRRITGLEPDPRRPGAVRVLVDGRAFCTVDQAAASAAGLAVGAEWDQARGAAAERAADEEAAWRALLRGLERRNFAVGEIRRRLRQKGHPPAAVEYALGRGLAAGLLDDLAFARRYAESRAARGRGPARLRRDLTALGVARAVVEQVLAEQWSDPDRSLQVARQLAERRAGQLGRVEREVKYRRLIGFLGRRGFAGPRVGELVRAVLAREGRPAEDS